MHNQTQEKTFTLSELQTAIRNELEAYDERKQRKECEEMYYQQWAMSVRLGIKPPIKPKWMQ